MALTGLAPNGAGTICHCVAYSVESLLLLSNLASIISLIEPEANALGFDLVRVMWIKGEEPTLQVMAERPETRQLNIDDCSALSHRISDKFDELDPIEEAYRLEVSSPGIDRPLTRLKDYADWAGHEAKVEISEPIAGQKRFRGDLDGVDASGDAVAIIDSSGIRHILPYAAIISAKLVLTDRLIASTAPLNSAGVDAFEDETSADQQED
jgi:ribosome maturation factor RimP